MDKFFLTILIFSFVACSSQNKISGDYCYSFNAGDGNCIEFKKSNRFNWESTGDLGTYYVGSGIYSLEGEMLILNFDKNIGINKSKIKIESISNNSDDEVRLRFRILDNKKQPLPGVRVTIKQDSHLNFQSDIEGYLEINLPKEAEPTKIEISNLLGYENVKFNLIPNSDKEINVELYPQQPEKISDKIFQFKILSFTKDTLDLINPSGQRQKFVKQ